MDLAYTFAGFAVGVIVGLTGVGGGSLMTPLLVLMFGINPAVAVGTDLLYAAITKGGGTLVHGLKGSVDWRIARLLASGSIPAAIITLAIIGGHLPEGIASASGLIEGALGVALLLTALALIFRRQIQNFALARRGSTPCERRNARYTIAVGAVIGVLVSISSVGAGALGATALIFLYPRLPTLRIVGTEIAHAVPLTAVAGLGHWFLGSVDWLLLGCLLIGSLPGIWLGSQISARLPDRILRPALATMLALVGARLISH